MEAAHDVHFVAQGKRFCAVVRAGSAGVTGVLVWEVTPVGDPELDEFSRAA